MPSPFSLLSGMLKEAEGGSGPLHEEGFDVCLELSPTKTS